MASTLAGETLVSQAIAPAPERSSLRRWWGILLVVWLISAIYSGSLLKRGWIPYDEGTFAQSAERVLAGELPHRDYGDPYTGGLAFLNAFAFWLFGTNFASMRIVLFIFLLAWIPAFYNIATRFFSPWGAGLATLLAVAWSLPNYSAPMNSWYNLFFATFGTLAILRFLESRARLWLFVAGICGGVSFLFKIAGLYYVAGALLFFLYRAQVAEEVQQKSLLEYSQRRGWKFRVLVLGCLLILLGAVFIIIRRSLSFVALIQFVLPVVALGILSLRQNEVAQAPSRRPFKVLFREVMPFAAGVALPIVLFLMPYVLSGSVSSFVRGVFVLPTRLQAAAARRPPGFNPIRTYGTVVLVLLLFAGGYGAGRIRKVTRGLLLVAMTFVLLASAKDLGIYQFIWAPLTFLIPLAVFAGVYLLSTKPLRENLSPARRQEIMLLLCVTALCSLIQLPLPVANYFCYVEPLLILTLLALLSMTKKTSTFILVSLTVFYIAFAVFRFTPTFVYEMGYHYVPNHETSRLTLARAGGLRVHPAEVSLYQQLIPLVQEHAGESKYVYCAPDCPQVPFLAGLRNPTRILFDFYEDSAGHMERVLNALEAHHVKVVGFYPGQGFSKPLDPELQAALRQRFPGVTWVGQYEVRWRQ